ncbi:hypothetical protein J3R83DRAFT_9918, partial [Lanmaoa asiatica]
SVYYWNGIWNGTADIVMHVHLRTAQPKDVPGIYAPDNVRRAWSSVKRRFPLIAAEVHEEDSGLHFVVREQNVTSLLEEDVTLVWMAHAQYRPGHFHVVLTIAHCITDRCTTSTVLRSFFQTLATSFDPYPAPIEERLQMCYSIESRVFSNDIPLVKQRWRRAIGYAFHVARRTQLRGGHTLPGNFTRATTSTPAKSRLQVVSFPRDVSALILSNCRRHNITLNAAYHALSQVAHSRLLCRRYLRGEIPEEEWEYRKRQPMLFGGVVNLRPYWDDWFHNGGSGEVGLNIGSYVHHVLPFMPLGAMASKNIDHLELVDGAPLFQDLMSFDRFLLRCEWVRLESEKLSRSPWFLEICVATHNNALEGNAMRAATWRRAGERVVLSAEAQQPVPSQGPVFAQRGSNLGDMDHMIPLDYPMPASHQLSPLSSSPHPHRAGYPVCTVPDDVALQCETPRLHVEYWQTHVRILPGDIYVGALTSRKQLQYFSLYDENVYSRDITRELLGEIKEATLWYLGRPQQAAATEVKCKL